MPVFVSDIDKAVPVVEESDKDLKKRKKTTSSVAAAIMVPHEVGPAVDRLWTYQCPITKGRNVSCMTWNRSNPVSHREREYAARRSL